MKKASLRHKVRHNTHVHCKPGTASPTVFGLHSWELPQGKLLTDAHFISLREMKCTKNVQNMSRLKVNVETVVCSQEWQCQSG